jgi:cytoskeletal protein CcmA (bactofilin family)
MQTDEQLNDSAAPSAPTVSAAAPVASSTYVPTAPAARPAAASEPARSAAPAASTYRPTPIAEFNRGAARTTSDVRPASSAPAASSFSSIGEKTSAGKSNRRVLTVGNDILLKGEIATCDRLVIEGRVEAKLSEVHTVEIAEVGSFKGTAEVEDAEVSGLFEGDLIVRNRLVIYASGEVRGNITYGEIEIERGGRMTGQIKTVAAGSKGSKNAFESPDKVRAATKETVAA